MPDSKPVTTHGALNRVAQDTVFIFFPAMALWLYTEDSDAAIRVGLFLFGAKWLYNLTWDKL